MNDVLKSFLMYFVVTSVIFSSAYLFRQDSVLSVVVPIFLSIILLVPIYIWQRNYAEKEKLSEEVDGRERSIIVFWILILLILALIVRVPSVLLFGEPYEKTPLIYLIVLTMIVIEKTDVVAFGFKSQNIGKSFLSGLIFYLVFAGSMLSIQYSLVYAFTGHAMVESFDILFFLLAMPFHMLCVGISEEGLFRGYMQTHLEKVFTVRKAILIQAVLFGIWHFVWNLYPLNVWGMIEYVLSSLFWGLVVGYFYSKARSLVPVVLIHGLWNSVILGIITNETAFKALETTPILDQVAVMLLPSILSGILAFIFIKYLVKRLD
ncbi:MAG: CPBP family intramembrane metalloprotease [Candidatus Bathyarchaeota archaeon]|nr:CPBP family intramembrane metalloprotease [Candidatus Bathyarchaeota archaeon]MDH5732375.1 CPBP family intramembrane metalloprotease [Candidatus Bathyarchaeota archaeon]